MSKDKPTEVYSPGVYLQDDLDALGWTAQEAGRRTRLPVEIIQGILSTKQEITPAIAENLGRAFRVSAQYWLNLEKAWKEREV